jgi:hypothetical protein
VKYVLMLGDGTDSGTKAAARVCEAGWMPRVTEMQERGVMLHGSEMLAPASSSAMVQVSSSEVVVTDGPFAETRERIGGYQLIECANVDKAIHAASRHPLVVGCELAGRGLMARHSAASRSSFQPRKTTPRT